jgi:hypothetical protein
VELAHLPKEASENSPGLNLRTRNRVEHCRHKVSTKDEAVVRRGIYGPLDRILVRRPSLVGLLGGPIYDADEAVSGVVLHHDIAMALVVIVDEGKLEVVHVPEEGHGAK